MVLLPVPGWTGFCQETLDPRDEGERLWECVWRRVLLLGKVNLEMGCHGYHHRLSIGTWTQGEQGLIPGVPLLPPRVAAPRCHKLLPCITACGAARKVRRGGDKGSGKELQVCEALSEGSPVTASPLSYEAAHAMVPLHCRDWKGPEQLQGCCETPQGERWALLCCVLSAMR